jgi:4-diphosphocytidyl-2-C-methyl-D-erythritol kinase
VRKLTWQKINLFDIVHIKVSENPRQKGDFSIFCDNPGVPQGNGNIWAKTDSPVYQNNCRKALAVMFGELKNRGLSVDYGVEIRIQKNIPLVGGLGGSASDSAAVMLGLNELWDLNMTEDELSQLGAKNVGHDVAFLLRKYPLYLGNEAGTIGNIKNPQKIFFVRVTPNIHLSAKDAYEGLIPLQQQFRERALYSTDKFRNLLESGNFDYTQMINTFDNELERSQAAFPKHPQLKELKNDIARRNPVINAMMSGSGPTILGFVRSRSEAETLSQILSSDYPDFEVGWNFTLDYVAEMINF